MRSILGAGAAVAMLLSFSKIVRGQGGGEPGAATRAVTGVVRDTTGRPIEGVEVRVNARPLALTDASGQFRLGTVAGTATLSFRRLGYEPASRVLGPGETTSVEIAMLPNSQLLRTIVVEGRAYDKELWANGFYRRQKVASGSFFDPDFLAHFGGNGVASLLHEVPRVQVQNQNGQDYAFSTVAGRRCRMNVYVDGVFQRATMPGPLKPPPGSGTFGYDALGLNELVDYRDVRGVEVYPRATSVPIQFSRMGPPAGPQGNPMPRIPSPTGAVSGSATENQDAACGAIVIWTTAPGEK